MKHDEFIKLVQERGCMSSRDQAEAATLGTLGERLAGGEPHDLASQLPPELAGYVRYDGEQQSDPFSVEEFFERVARREGVSPEEAERHARVVAEVLGEAITGGELGDVLSQLPDEYRRLFGRQA